MNYLAIKKLKQTCLGMDYLKIITIILVLMYPCQKISSQSDSFGQTDRFYIDSVVSTPGQDIWVHFYLNNDEELSSLSIPIKYDTNLLTLKSISFSDSRVEYISNKIMTPSSVQDINGHFLTGMFIVLEEPIPAGDGLIFSGLFTVSASAKEGEIALIDTLFYPPAGEMILVEAASAAIIKPIFDMGKIYISSFNYAPSVSSIEEQYVFEGDSLVLDISASDINNDSLTLICTDKPAGAIFSSNHDGTASFSWQPDYIGPYSSDGSPFKINLWVSDGDKSSEKEFTINVVNKNRKPVISAQNSYEFESGDLVEFNISASDLDFEPISWSVINLPENSTFSQTNPAVFSWQTSLSDTGSYDMTIVAADPQGFADTSQVRVSLNPTVIYTMVIDTLSGYPGEIVDVNINLNNEVPIGSFNLLIHYDPTVLTVTGITNADTRSSSFELFNSVIDENSVPGNIRLTGIADQSGSSSNPLLSEGDGSIGVISFRIVSNIIYAGMVAPIRFIFKDDLTLNDNTLTDTIGTKIAQGAIEYYDGYVNILKMGTVNRGDINLNGIAFDIGDAIYFTNYFMNPFEFPLNPLQYANSDINNDSFGGTIGDLVALINIIINGNKTGKNQLQSEFTADLKLIKNNDGITLIGETDFDIGAILLKIDARDLSDDISVTNLNDNMTLVFNRVDSELSILIYSFEGHTIGLGTNELLKIENTDELIINSIELADARGQNIEANLVLKNEALPDRFLLHQNYPNPFNPTTNISFELPEHGKVMLAIYNILGKKVKIIIDDEMSAGIHTMVWDSRDQNGSAVASGIYFYRLETSSESLTRKMVLLK